MSVFARMRLAPQLLVILGLTSMIPIQMVVVMSHTGIRTVQRVALARLSHRVLV